MHLVCRNPIRFASATTAVLILLGAAALLATTGEAQGQAPRKKVSFRERLVFGLEARRPSELAFLDAVIDTVNRGEMPRKLVDRTFFWARERSPKQAGKFLRRPIIYFQPALSIQANRLKINIRRTPPPSSDD